MLAAAVVGDLRRALADTSARVAYLGNLRADGAEARGYDLAAHVAALARHGIHPDVAVVATGGLPLGELGLAIVEADVARPDRMAHDPDRLGAALATLVGMTGPDWNRRSRSARIARTLVFDLRSTSR